MNGKETEEVRQGNDQPLPAQSNTSVRETYERHDNTDLQQLGPIDHSMQVTYQNRNKIIVGKNEFVNIYMKCGLDGNQVNPSSGKEVSNVFIQTIIEKRSKDDTVPQCQPPRTRTLVRMAPIVEFKHEVIPTKRKRNT